MNLPITAAVAAICGLLLLLTGVLTVRQRFRLKQSFGLGDDPALMAASRSHGNLAEHAPIVIAMLALLEANHADGRVLAVVAALFVIGRVLHIIGLQQGSAPGKPPLPRKLGVILTWLTLGVLAVWLLAMLAGG